MFFSLEGKDRQLCSVDLKQLTSRARQVNSAVPLTALTSQGIEKITNCHLFAVGQVRVKHFLCVKTFFSGNEVYLNTRFSTTCFIFLSLSNERQSGKLFSCFVDVFVYLRF